MIFLRYSVLYYRPVIPSLSWPANAGHPVEIGIRVEISPEIPVCVRMSPRWPAFAGHDIARVNIQVRWSCILGMRDNVEEQIADEVSGITTKYIPCRAPECAKASRESRRQCVPSQAHPPANGYDSAILRSGHDRHIVAQGAAP